MLGLVVYLEMSRYGIAGLGMEESLDCYKHKLGVGIQKIEYRVVVCFKQLQLVMPFKPFKYYVSPQGGLPNSRHFLTGWGARQGGVGGFKPIFYCYLTKIFVVLYAYLLEGFFKTSSTFSTEPFQSLKRCQSGKSFKGLLIG